MFPFRVVYPSRLLHRVGLLFLFLFLCHPDRSGRFFPPRSSLPALSVAEGVRRPRSGGTAATNPPFQNTMRTPLPSPRSSLWRWSFKPASWVFPAGSLFDFLRSSELPMVPFTPPRAAD
jgi:hypothetical protein